MATAEWFPFQYRPVQQWHAVGLPITTPSDEAAKFLDSALAQMILMDSDTQMGGMEEAWKKAMQADPDFFFAKVVMATMEVQGAPYKGGAAAEKKLFDLKEQAKKNDKLSSWELSHLDAGLACASNDWLEAERIWGDILTEHPQDMYAANLAFFGSLHTGRRRGLRDIPARIVKDFKQGERYYGNLNAKLCFGYGENCQFEMAEKHGNIALEQTPRDIWAIHSMAHVKEESLKSREGIQMLRKMEANWSNNGNLNTHVWWHMAGFHFQLGEYEQALTLFDDTIKPLAVRSKMSFPMSDATALLLRLEMFGKPAGTSYQERWRELGNVCVELCDSINNVFYDFHALVATLFGDKRAAAMKLQANINEQSDEFDRGESKDYNFMVAKKVGNDIAKATIAFADEDYSTCVTILHPIRFDWHDLLGGSHAQKVLLDLMLIQAAIRSGQKKLAGQLLEEKIARSGNCHEECSDSNLISRLMEKLASMH